MVGVVIAAQDTGCDLCGADLSLGLLSLGALRLLLTFFFVLLLRFRLLRAAAAGAAASEKSAVGERGRTP